MTEYCNHEFEEFDLKCDKFELNDDAKIECYNLGNSYIYFALGKMTDKAVFEAIFLWDEDSGKVKGNQYKFRLEPKIQFTKNLITNSITYNRRINIKPANNEIVKTVLVSSLGHDFHFISNELEEHLGGNFYSLTYHDDENNKNTYWNKLTVFSNKGTIKHPILMRGIDHPLFQNDLFPILLNQNSFKIKDDLFPVIINIVFDDNQEIFYKYPLEKEFIFNKKIKQICLTDNLSFDWIVN
jgi:hypothetical protein